MRLSRLVIPLSLFVIAGFAQDVRYNYARGADFSKYRTYSWEGITNSPQTDQLVAAQIQSALDAELSRKGLLKMDANADLLVSYQTAVSEEKQFTAYTYSSGFGWGGPGWGYGAGWGYGPGWDYVGSATTFGQTSTIQIGTLGLNMYDASTHQLIWRGEASRTLDPRAKPDKMQKQLDKAVAKLLKNFPPRDKKPPVG